MFTAAVLLHLMSGNIVNALPHASCIVGVKLSFYFIFVLSFGGFNGFPEVIVGLFLFFHISCFKSRGSS